MADATLRYRVSGADWTLEFSATAIAALRRWAQRWWRTTESVGQLFSLDLTGDVIVVDVATRLKPRWSKLSSVQFDPALAARERNALFAQGLHCIGFWHTHPERLPTPSKLDQEFAADHARAVRPVLTGIVFVIVGTAPFPSGLGVWLNDGERQWRAEPLQKSPTNYDGHC